MMKSIKHLCLAVAILATTAISAQNQTITLKDGTIYDGFISRQDYKSGTGQITYSMVTKQIPVEQIRGRRTEKRELGTLSKEWQTWAEENHKVETSGKDKKYLSLTSMTVLGVTKDWYILISGSKVVTALTVTEGIDSIRMSDIQSITKPERDKTLLTDMDDIIQTDAMTITGVVLEQKPGKMYTIWNKDDNTVHNIDYAEIRSIGRGRLNPDCSMWAQTPFLERLTLKKGQTATGLIIENTLSPSISFLFAEKNDKGESIRQYSLSEVTGLERFRNDEYAPIHDIVLGENESRVNRDSILVEATIGTVYTRDSSKVFYLEPDHTETIATVTGPEVTIETSIQGISDIFVAKAVVTKNVPMSYLKPDTTDAGKKAKKKKDEEKVDIQTFTYATLFESEIETEVSTSINGTTKIVFTLPEPGLYYVYLRRLNKTWAINWN